MAGEPAAPGPFLPANWVPVSMEANLPGNLGDCWKSLEDFAHL